MKKLIITIHCFLFILPFSFAQLNERPNSLSFGYAHNNYLLSHRLELNYERNLKLKTIKNLKWGMSTGLAAYVFALLGDEQLEDYDVFIRPSLNLYQKKWKIVDIRTGLMLEYLLLSKYFVPHLEIGLQKQFGKSRWFVDASLRLSRDINRRLIRTLPGTFQLHPYRIPHEYEIYSSFNLAIGRMF